MLPLVLTTALFHSDPVFDNWTCLKVSCFHMQGQICYSLNAAELCKCVVTRTYVDSRQNKEFCDLFAHS
jgi:hypothetical protein